MISDPNPMVVANAVAALAEISENSGKDVLQINSTMLGKLLAALNECTEWGAWAGARARSLRLRGCAVSGAAHAGQVFILDMLAKYRPSPKEAENITERVMPRLQARAHRPIMPCACLLTQRAPHSTPTPPWSCPPSRSSSSTWTCVCRARTRAQLSCRPTDTAAARSIENAELERNLVEHKLPPPLLTLLSGTPPEVQYVALRNINLIVQKRADILSKSAPPARPPARRAPPHTPRVRACAGRCATSSASTTTLCTSRWRSWPSWSCSSPTTTSTRCCSRLVPRARAR